MRSASATATRKATLRSEARFTRSGSGLHFFRAVPRLAGILWPEKTAAEMALRTKTTERACREILNRNAVFSTGALISLLQSEEGFLFLKEVMGTSKPTWWKWAERAVHLGNMRRELERQRKAIEQYELQLADQVPQRKPRR